METLESVKKMILIKKKPNRKPFPKESAIYGKCGHRCDLCIHFTGGTIMLLARYTENNMPIMQNERENCCHSYIDQVLIGFCSPRYKWRVLCHDLGSVREQIDRRNGILRVVRIETKDKRGFGLMT